MQWPRLRKSPEIESREAAADKPAAPLDPRLKRLAQKLDELPAKDELRMRAAREIEVRQRQGAIEMHDLCAALVRDLNSVMVHMNIELMPPAYNPDTIHSPSGTLFQINATGRIVQIAILPPDVTLCTDHFRIPYLLRGAIRWFNQESLERQEIQESLVFYCVERGEYSWRYVDSRSRKSGMVDPAFLMEAMEQLL